MSTPERIPIQNEWLNFVANTKSLLVVQPDEHILNQYLGFREAVFERVESEIFLTALREAWPPFNDYPQVENGEALLLELQAFSQTVINLNPAANPDEMNKWLSILLSQASTVAESVKELLDDLSFNGKNIITLFCKLIDLFKAKD